MMVRELRIEASMSYSISPCCPGNTKGKSVGYDVFITTLLRGPHMDHLSTLSQNQGFLTIGHQFQLQHFVDTGQPTSYSRVHAFTMYDTGHLLEEGFQQEESVIRAKQAPPAVSKHRVRCRFKKTNAFVPVLES